MDLTALKNGILTRDSLSISKGISLLESNSDEGVELLKALESHMTGRVIGITGPPGVGKSTLCGKLAEKLHSEGVGVLAVDPTSPYSGGALLGDRIRIETEHVFIRSQASGLQLGGLAPRSIETVELMRAAFSYVIVETVGIGQSEMDIRLISDVMCLVLQPGTGDSLQLMKAGIMGVPDIMICGKADMDMAKQFVKDIKAATSKPVYAVSAHTGEGLDELLTAVKSFDSQHQMISQLVARQIQLEFGNWGVRQLGGYRGLEKQISEIDGSRLTRFEQMKKILGVEHVSGNG